MHKEKLLGLSNGITTSTHFSIQQWEPSWIPFSFWTEKTNITPHNKTLNTSSDWSCPWVSVTTNQLSLTAPLHRNYFRNCRQFEFTSSRAANNMNQSIQLLKCWPDMLLFSQHVLHRNFLTEERRSRKSQWSQQHKQNNRALHQKVENK